jgi:hypothetical protein
VVWEKVYTDAYRGAKEKPIGPKNVVKLVRQHIINRLAKGKTQRTMKEPECLSRVKIDDILRVDPQYGEIH